MMTFWQNARIFSIDCQFFANNMGRREYWSSHLFQNSCNKKKYPYVGRKMSTDDFSVGLGIFSTIDFAGEA